MTTRYDIDALDAEGYEITRYSESTLKAAKEQARYLMSGAYQSAVALVEPVAKVRVTKVTERDSVCIFDLFR
jgi:hypothetical protein